MSTQEPHILTRIEDAVGFITLNRPGALNALSLPMIRTLRETLDAWAADPAVQVVVLDTSSDKGLCAGGDIRFFHEAAHSTPRGTSPLLEDFFTEEYALNHLIANYPKPYVAMMVGVTMGGGMGIAETGWLRVVSENSKIAMPEVNIGLFPDVGGTWFLARAPGELGTYLGVTGEVIGAADTLHCGMADVFVPLAERPRFLKAIRSLHAPSRAEMAQKARQYCAREFTLRPTPGQFMGLRPYIDEVFASNSIAEILEKLDTETRPEFIEFAQKTRATMGKRSPLLMQVSLAAMRRARHMTLAEALRMERNLVRRTFEHGEVVEGVRALVIDKDNRPAWNPPIIEAVSDAMVDRFFEPCWPARMHPLRELA